MFWYYSNAPLTALTLKIYTFIIVAVNRKLCRIYELNNKIITNKNEWFIRFY